MGSSEVTYERKGAWAAPFSPWSELSLNGAHHPLGSTLRNPVLLTVSSLASPEGKAAQETASLKAEFYVMGFYKVHYKIPKLTINPNTCDSTNTTHLVDDSTK